MRSGAKTALKWIERRIPYGKSWAPYKKSAKPKKLKGPKNVEASYMIFEGRHPDDRDAGVRMYVAEFDLGDGSRVAVVGSGPGDRKWSKYEKAWAKMAKSFKRLEVAAVEGAALNSKAPRDVKRAKLLKEVQRLDGWELHETENYFVVTEIVDDKQFINELKVRLEAIRDVFEVDYPADKARKIKRQSKKKKPKTGKDEKGEGDDEEEEELDPNRTISVIDPLIMSRTSVVRVCKNRTSYHKYGGPGGSAGYWNSRTEELVIYDDKAGGGRRDTWIVLNHEAFHQYIYYFYGNISPHSWYNEGTGDFYSGYEYKHGKFKLRENPWRNRTVQEMVRTGEYAPLDIITSWTQSQYYGSNDLGMGGGQSYAQGWSIIYFLRTGPKEEPDGWDPAWNNILDTYLETLGTTGDLEEAVEKAFDGVNWGDLEECWKKYIG